MWEAYLFLRCRVCVFVVVPFLSASCVKVTNKKEWIWHERVGRLEGNREMEMVFKMVDWFFGARGCKHITYNKVCWIQHVCKESPVYTSSRNTCVRPAGPRLVSLTSARLLRETSGSAAAKCSWCLHTMFIGNTVCSLVFQKRVQSQSVVSFLSVSSSITLVLHAVLLLDCSLQ